MRGLLQEAPFLPPVSAGPFAPAFPTWADACSDTRAIGGGGPLAGRAALAVEQDAIQRVARSYEKSAA